MIYYSINKTNCKAANKVNFFPSQWGKYFGTQADETRID